MIIGSAFLPAYLPTAGKAGHPADLPVNSILPLSIDISRSQSGLSLSPTTADLDMVLEINDY
jgi:hypothetical protein